MAATSEVTEYIVTMNKIELCSDLDCSKAEVLSDTSFEADIAGNEAGAGVGSMPLNFTPTIGDTFSYIAITLNRTFTITGEWSSGASTCSTATAGANVKNATGQASTPGTSISMYIADDTTSANGSYDIDIGVSANWGQLGWAKALTWVDGSATTATQARVIYSLAKPYTVTTSPPQIAITINTEGTIAQNGSIACTSAFALMIKDPDFQFSIQ